jgi:hypothetical protein
MKSRTGMICAQHYSEQGWEQVASLFPVSVGALPWTDAKRSARRVRPLLRIRSEGVTDRIWQLADGRLLMTMVGEGWSTMTREAVEDADAFIAHVLDILKANYA